MAHIVLRLIRHLSALTLACAIPTGCSHSPSTPGDARQPDLGASTPADAGAPDAAPALPAVTLRVATFNASLFRPAEGQLLRDLEGGGDAQAKRVAEVLQRVRPDIVLLNEFDRDPEGRAAQIFAQAYLATSQSGAEPLEMPYWYVPRSNTGEHSGVDLEKDGQAVAAPGSRAYGNDAYGYGLFPGQYGMVIFSRFPLVADAARTFQTLRWKDMPDNLMPTDWYSPAAVEAMRLSSKNHLDLAVDVEGHRLHLLASHPTPPSFDGPEDRNGRRNHDEIRFWVDYLSSASNYIRDDAGQAGGLDPNAPFVILGDLNCDPMDGDSRREALLGLLAHDRVQDPGQTSAGGVEAASRDGRANLAHRGDSAQDTADFSDGAVGNLRVDYALPSSNLAVQGSGVFWPGTGEAQAGLAGVSDHHLVWVDVTMGGGGE